MKTRIPVISVLVTCMFFFGCSESNLMNPALDTDEQVEGSSLLKGAKKPAAKLVGDLNCPFSLENPPAFWSGTVDFGGDLGEFGLTFFSQTAPRGFSQASPFRETWVIYTLGEDYNDQANVVMRGWSKGVVTYANKAPEPVNFLENGKVTEAYGPLEDWEGCTWHVKGLVYFVAGVPGLPEKALGQVRIN